MAGGVIILFGIGAVTRVWVVVADRWFWNSGTDSALGSVVHTGLLGELGAEMVVS